MNKTSRLALTAVMMAIVMVSIMFIKIPIPFTQGFVHLGDGMILLAMLILGWKYGAIAAGIGAALGDVISGYAMWAPWTLVAKVVMVAVAGIIIEKVPMKSNWFTVMAMSLGGILMVGVYYLAEGVMYGNFVAPILALPWNIGQVVVGMALAMIIAFALSNSSLKKYFRYPVIKGDKIEAKAQS